MKKKAVTELLSVMLCLLLILPPAMAETREGVIVLEGMEEPIEETLFESSLGFYFWYASERMEVYHGEADGIEGVVVDMIYSDDHMVLSMIPEEDAEAYAGDCGESIAEQSAGSRVQVDLPLEVENRQVSFCALIAENGQYLRAVGRYSEEAAEGNAKYFQRVLDSVTFTPGCPIHAEWGTLAPDEEGFVQVNLTALEPVTDIKLLSLHWDGITVSWEQDAPLGSLDALQSASVALRFIGDLPNNGIMYTDEAGAVHAFALDISGEDGRLYFWKLEE